jgi:hypothetical protein
VPSVTFSDSAGSVEQSGVTDNVLPPLNQCSLNPFWIRYAIERYDRLARRNYGLPDNQGESGTLNLNVLAGRGRTYIAIEQTA